MATSTRPSYRRFDHDPRLAPHPHLAELDRSAGTLERAVQTSGFSIGFPGWLLVYSVLLAHLDPDRRNVVLETGTNWGSTTIAIAQALVDSQCEFEFHSIELLAENCSIARSRLARAGLAGRVIVHQGSSLDVLRELLPRVGSVRLALLDGDHRRDAVAAEFALLLPYLEPDALVLFDNTGPPDGYEGVGAALLEICARHGGNLVNLPHVSWKPPGIALWQRRPFASPAPD
jgi:hypothetical protein